MQLKDLASDKLTQLLLKISHSDLNRLRGKVDRQKLQIADLKGKIEELKRQESGNSDELYSSDLEL